MDMPEVKLATQSNRDRILDTVALAFAADPLMRWLLPSAETYLKYFRPFADTYGGPSIESHSCYATTDFEGAAMWLPPDVAVDEDKMILLLAEAIAPALQEPAIELLSSLDQYHPDDNDCWYLAIIGVDPGQQHKGMGSTLMKHATAMLDEHGYLGYLESSNPMNISLYQRHGFEAMGEIRVADSPVITPMLRPRRAG